MRMKINVFLFSHHYQPYSVCILNENVTNNIRYIMWHNIMRINSVFRQEILTDRDRGKTVCAMWIGVSSRGVT